MKRCLGAAALSLGPVACRGSNNAFNNIQGWNADMSENKWVTQLVSFAFWIIPVYPIALFLDIIIFNSIEFWGGDNPISSGD